MQPFLIFDAYGTLVELDDFYQRLQRGFAVRGLALPLEAVQRAAHQEMRHYMAHAIQVRDEASWLGLRHDCARILAEAISAQSHAFSLSVDDTLAVLSEALVFHPFPQAKETLRRLRDAGIRMGVLSNWDYQLPAILRGVQLATFFEFIITSAEAGVEKPAAQFFERGLAKARALCPTLKPHDCFYIGDHYEKDVVAARAAGLTPLWLVRDQRDLASGDIHEAQDDVIRLKSLRDLLDLPALKRLIF